MKTNFSRRDLMTCVAVAAVGAAALREVRADEPAAKLRGNINHSVCRGCFGNMPLDEVCKAAKAMGLKGLDLTTPEDWPTLKKYGLVATMATGAGLGCDKGFNHVEYHEQLIPRFETLINKTAEAGFENVICMSGNRAGLTDEQGLANCAAGIGKLIPLAEAKKVTIHLELLNSKVNHKDYHADHTAWGVELCKRINSPRFKLLYDIYHMQIMEGDLIATIRANAKFIGHYHTAGVPGRKDIDETQEINYPAVMRAIAATGFRGYVAQEFSPKGKDRVEAFRKAVETCDV